MPYSIADIKKAYDILVQGIDEKAQAEDEEGNRAYGGALRSAKGFLVESIARNLVEIAWDELGGQPNRLSFERDTIRVPIRREYLKRVRPKEVANYIQAHLNQYFYSHRTDVHVSIDGQLVMGLSARLIPRMPC